VKENLVSEEVIRRFFATLRMTGWVEGQESEDKGDGVI
jgi:hypothetical protein